MSAITFDLEHFFEHFFFLMVLANVITEYKQAGRMGFWGKKGEIILSYDLIMQNNNEN